ncbi:Hypothetical Protein FCC1311_001091 [Hondaea fermentalgiana]|uniref:Uncharacterized protein n=1 Tax=Hondaea fermentalgiana TaxID=2315210 RepID=A0A2R5GKR5_9STRA|nr:Hypothetical Protein FCC1311_001091 [Hondaea fermentalgiana]|eukprot:GBG29213.1 Hypothetical Protein FCC1311_001091 [Hondaea fermentalgiana]
MGLIGHVGVRRANRESRSSVVDACVDKLASGVSVYLFAEEARRVIEAGVITEVSPSDLSANVTTATGASA